MKPKHPSELLWFRFHARDLALGAWLSFRLHVVRCAHCKARLAKATSERASIEALLDGGRPAARAPSRSWIVMSFATVAAVAIVLFFIRPKPQDEVPVDDPGLRAKGGGSSFVIHVAKDGGTELLGDRCHPGDALQAEYRSERPYLAIVGVDPANETRMLVPLDGTESQRLAGKGAETAPQSWVLDDVKGRERFVAFFSDAPIDAKRARMAAALDHPQVEGSTAIVRECTKGGAP